VQRRWGSDLFPLTGVPPGRRTRSGGFLPLRAPRHRGGRHGSERPDLALAALDEALALWRGHAYAEFADADFARAEASRLDELRLAAVEERFDALLALGEHGGVAGEIEAFASRHPFRERPRGQLMIALYRSGRQAEALAAYQALRRSLAEELGLEPSAHLQALEARILRQDPSLSWSAPQLSRTASDRQEHLVERSGSEPGDSVPSRLPVAVTSFVGREGERSSVLAALATSRFVTLVGPGGSGKTRLALEVATAAADRYPGGVWWCELASVTAEDAVGHVLVSCLGAHEADTAAIEDTLVRHLGTRQALVVVDNCEHVRSAAARLIDGIVRRCPRVSVLATSRTRLGAEAERIWSVPPLQVPTESDDPRTASRAPAVELFVDRARAVRPRLDLNDDETATVAAVCRRLDGLPLAIELAAARMASLNASDILQRLDHKFGLLTDARPTGLPRHRTLDAVIDWSYALLSQNEQRLFERLTVFAGGFTLDAAERVCAGGEVAEDEIMDLLARLVDHSMVATAASRGRVRYGLLETLRQYGRHRLEQRGDFESVSAAHAGYYVALAEETTPALSDAREAEAVSLLDQELANLRAAHHHAVAVRDTDLAMRLAASLFRYALFRLRDELFRWASAALALPGAGLHTSFAVVSGMAGWGCGLRGEREAAAAIAEGALARLDPEDPARRYLLEVLLHLAMWEGRPDECHRLCQEATALSFDTDEWLPRGADALALAYSGRTEDAIAAARSLWSLSEDRGNPTLAAYACYALGEATMERDPDGAATLFDRAMALAGSVDNRILLGVAAVSAASLHARHGSPDDALRAFGAVIDHLHRGADWTHLWVGLRSLIELFARLGVNEAAAVLHAAVTTAHTAPPAYGADATRLVALGRALEGRLGPAGVAATRARAAVMADEQVLAFARGEIERCRTERRDDDSISSST